MKKKITMFLLTALIIFAVNTPQTTYAFATTSAPSASFAADITEPSLPVKQDHRADILKKYLQSQNSPLADHADTIIKEADKNHIDWKLLPAIAGLESCFGQEIPALSYNGWGFGIYGNNVRRFGSWDEGISTVSAAIRNVYMNERGAQNIYEIGSTYAASPTWATRVTGYMNDIADFEAAYNNNNSVSISL